MVTRVGWHVATWAAAATVRTRASSGWITCRGQDHHDTVGVASVYGQGAQDHGRRCIATHGFAQHMIGVDQAFQLGHHRVGLLLVGEHEPPVPGDQGGEALLRGPHQTFRSGQGQQLLGTLLAAERPEPVPDPPARITE